MIVIAISIQMRLNSVMKSITTATTIPMKTIQKVVIRAKQGKRVSVMRG